ncbi:metalloregulator ArsR/SmtB family transcription factor [Arthrobacter alpinus]|uniref:ArsR family transcriptional regulator n=1 Tax=Arthrobacter alpinus TaxID=656366 RepID=A0A0S2LWG8_9MICC|nr:metalloregulator ArsR/SmtB family transcription factor [Arthrobacter alpinus]ALO65649.1 ArsR family transcriptional regulator [Arthrobacter alpinus]MDD0859550.1 metalloregulator ArsR/SmtB family transcription factor [Arthrobacter alpinus]
MKPISNAAVLARFGYALSDPTRAEILMNLAKAPQYPAELAAQLGVTRQNMSNHLSCLRDCGLAVAIAEGRRSRYELAHPDLAHALNDLLGVVLLANEGHLPHP